MVALRMHLRTCLFAGISESHLLSVVFSVLNFLSSIEFWVASLPSAFLLLVYSHMHII